jgi:GTP-binding protein HflX
LDETREADILVHVIDISHAQHEDQIKTVHQTLKELNAGEKPMLMVFNKVDAYRDKYFDPYVDQETRGKILQELSQKLHATFQLPNVFISATARENIDLLREILTHMIRDTYQVRYPFVSKQW